MTAPAGLEARQLILDAALIRRQPRQVLHPGVSYALLWRRGGNSAGILWVDAGAEVPVHTHAAAEHHIWLAKGRAMVDGQLLRAGAYWHVPPGVPHGVASADEAGCELFYLYLRR
jgi:mannose-6-phosphate isomerase-like protein (cupin superfamily)